MKKLLVGASIIAVIISMTACGESGVSQEEYDAVVAELEELKSKQAEEDVEVTTIEFIETTEETSETADIGKIAADNTENTASAAESGIEILAEYTYADSIGWYTYHFIVVKNNSNKTLDVTTSSIAYDSNGNVLGADDADFDALGAGCTSVMYEAFEIDGTVAKYDTNISTSESKYYESVIQDLQYTQSDIANGAVFQVTNNGSEAAEFVEGYALFIKDGNLVSYDKTYFIDDDSEIKPGATVTKQLDTTKDFDSVQFYLTGRR